MSAPSINTREILQEAMGRDGVADGAMDSMVKLYAAFWMTGPLSRGLGTMGLSYLVLRWLQPGFLYVDGMKRPWSLLSDSDEATLMSVELVSIILGFIASGL